MSEPRDPLELLAELAELAGRAKTDDSIDGTVLNLVASVGKLAGAIRALAVQSRQDRERLAALEERFREHGHTGEDGTSVGLGSCWDGS